MDFLLDPNVAYIFLLGGVFLGMMALVTPGTGLFEVGSFFALALAGYAIFNLSINGWALMFIFLSIIPFIYAIQKPKRELFLGLSIFLLVVGSAFLFTTDGWLPAVNPVLAFLVSGSMAGFLWLVVRKTIQAGSARPVHDLEGLVGMAGEARTKVQEEGSVFISGELWSAKSENGKPIPAGSQIRVLRREGFILVVEKLKH